MSILRLAGVILGLVLFLGLAVFFFFRYAFTAEGLHRVQTAVGIDAAAPERHIVPAGFSGWAVLHFGVDGAAPLTTDQQTLVIEYPLSGELETSTPAPGSEGFVHREYFARTEEGLMPMRRTGEIWGEYNLRLATDDQGAIVSRSAGFFVGTMTEFREAKRPHGMLEIPELPPPPN